jgi:hypothetical protein
MATVEPFVTAERDDSRSYLGVPLRVNYFLAKRMESGYSMSIETVGGTSVSSVSRGEDGCHESAGAAHFHAASPAHLKFNPSVSL